MTTTTTRFGLTKIQPLSDNVDVVVDFNNNWDAIDQKLGSQVCTSSTRPSSPVQGMEAFETDTGFVRVYTGSAWKTAGNAVGTSGARPANPIQGDEFYETDTGYSRSRASAAWGGFLPSFTNASPPANPIAGDLYYVNDADAVARYTGSAWKFNNIVVCTSGTRPTGGAVALGTFIYETDTQRYLLWNGSAWQNEAYSAFLCTSSSHPANPFRGLDIFETDTGLSAIYNGTNYMYGVQQLAPTQSVSAAASVTFSGIPAVNRLFLVWRLRSSTAGTPLSIQIDGDTTSGHYAWAKITGRSAAASASGNSSDVNIQIGTVAGAGTANYFSSGSTWINGWNSTNGFCVTESGSECFDTSSSYWIDKMGGVFSGSAAAHTSLKILPGSGTLTGEAVIYGGP